MPRVVAVADVDICDGREYAGREAEAADADKSADHADVLAFCCHFLLPSSHIAYPTISNHSQPISAYTPLPLARLTCKSDPSADFSEFHARTSAIRHRFLDANLRVSSFKHQKDASTCVHPKNLSFLFSFLLAFLASLPDMFGFIKIQYRMNSSPSHTPPGGPSGDPRDLFTPESPCVNPAEICPRRSASPVIADDLTNGDRSFWHLADAALNTLAASGSNASDWESELSDLTDEEVDELDSSVIAPPPQAPRSLTPDSPSPQSAPPHSQLAPPRAQPAPLCAPAAGTALPRPPLLGSLPGPMPSFRAPLTYCPPPFDLVVYSSSEEVEEVCTSKERASSVPPPSSPLKEQVGGGRQTSVPPPSTPTRCRLKRVPTSREPELVEQARVRRAAVNSAPGVPDQRAPATSVPTPANPAAPFAPTNPTAPSPPTNPVARAPIKRAPTKRTATKPAPAPLPANPAAPSAPANPAAPSPPTNPAARVATERAPTKHAATKPAPAPSPAGAFKPSEMLRRTHKGGGIALLSAPVYDEQLEQRLQEEEFEEVALPPPPPSHQLPPPSSLLRDRRLDAYLEKEGFVDIQLPPPPVRPSSLSPRPPSRSVSPLPLSAIDGAGGTKLDAGLDPDVDDIVEAAEGSAVAVDSAVAVNSAEREARAVRMQRCFDGMVGLAQECAVDINSVVDSVLQVFINRPSPTRSTNGWNQYQKYANSSEFRAEERARIDADFRAELEVHPQAIADPLGPAELKLAYAKFRDAHPDGRAVEILERWDLIEQLEDVTTIGGRQRHFTKTSNALVSTLRTMSTRHKYQSILVIVGSHLQEDGRLGIVHTSGGLDKVFGLLRTTDNDLLATAKMQAAVGEMGYTLLGALDGGPEAEAFAATSRENVAVASAASAKTRIAIVQKSAVKREPPDLLNVPPEDRERVRNSARHGREKDETNELQDALSAASIADIGYDIFCHGQKRVHTFAYKLLHTVLSSANVRIAGFPASVRLPRDLPKGKGIAALSAPERRAIMDAVDARCNPGQGVRIERHVYTPGSYVILSHDYTAVAPAGSVDSPPVQAFWRSSLGTPMVCMDGENAHWSAVYNLDGPLPADSPPPILISRPARGETAEPEEEVAAEVAADVMEKVKAKPKPKPAGKGKGKRAKEDMDDDIVEVSPPPQPKKQKKTTTRAADAPKPVSILRAPSRRPSATPATKRTQEGGGGRQVHFNDDDDKNEPESEDDDAPIRRPSRPPALKRPVAPTSSSDDDSEIDSRAHKRAKMAAEASATSRGSAAVSSATIQQMDYVEISPRRTRATTTRAAASNTSRAPAPNTSRAPAHDPAPITTRAPATAPTAPAPTRPRALSQKKKKNDCMHPGLNEMQIRPIEEGEQFWDLDGQYRGRVYTDPSIGPQFVVLPSQQPIQPPGPPARSWQEGPPPSAASSSRSKPSATFSPRLLGQPLPPAPFLPPPAAAAPPGTAQTPEALRATLMQTLMGFATLVQGGVDIQAMLDKLQKQQ
ncbi:hypothetical protein B0H19DRAFT_1250295 [Mycena capillaripes]|nr:hypothetical protein B0H19DRAFT_1250295 [Mycena capillaripes]